MKKLRMAALLLALCLLPAGLAGCQSGGSDAPDADAIMSEAMLAYQCFVQFSVKVDQTITGEVEIDGRSMRPVIDPRFSSMADLRAYAKEYFSDEICDQLLSQGHYLEQDGRLYSDNFDYAIDQSIAEVIYEQASRTTDEARYLARVIRLARNAKGEETSRMEETYEYVSKKTDRGWVFVSFPYFWAG